MATVLGKNPLVPIFMNTGALVAGSLVISDVRITANMTACAFYTNNSGAPANGGNLDTTVTAGTVTVTSSNASDANKVSVHVYEDA